MRKIPTCSLFCKQTIFLLIVCFCSIGKAFGQRYTFQNYNTENGLVQSQAITLAQDKSNRLWIGTVGGISVFDGSDFKSITRSDGLIGNTVTSIDFALNNIAWIGTSEGISCYNGLQFKNYKVAPAQEDNLIIKIQVDNRNRVWAQTPTKLYLFDGKAFVAQQLEDKLTAMQASPEGIIHIAYLEKGIFKFENDKWTKVTQEKGKQFYYNLSFSKTTKALYVLTAKGFCALENGMLRPLFAKYPKDNNFNALSKMYSDARGNIWITGSNGIWRYDGNAFKHLLSADGFTDDQCLSILEDNAKNIWLGTNGNGIYRYAYSPFRLFDNKNYPMSRNVFYIFQDQSGLMNLLTTNNGFYTFHPSENAIQKKDIPQIGAQYISAFYDADKGHYYSTIRGIFHQEGSAVKAIKMPSGVVGFVEVTDWKTVEGYVWFASNLGLCKIVGDSFQIVYPQAGIKKIALADNTIFLVGTKNGVFSFNTKTGAYDSMPDLNGKRVQCMLNTAPRLYIGTDDKGVLVYEWDTRKQYYINHDDGLSCNYVYNLLEDADHNLWVGTGCGIDQISFRNNIYSLKTYGKAYGLGGAESNEQASFQDKDGNIWFGTTKGLFVYNKSTEESTNSIPNVVITSIKLFSKDVPQKQHSDSTVPFYQIPYQPTFQHDENNLTFTFKAINISGTERITYRYKLEGADPAFVETKQNTVVYPQLPPGDYTFIVYASDENGGWHENAYKYPFTIKAVFYQTGRFQLLLGMFLAAGIAGIIYWLSKKKDARRRWEQRLREEEQDKVRHRTAEDFHDEIGNKITRINLLTMMAEKKSKEQPEVADLLAQIRKNTQSLYHGAKDIIWSLQNESNYLKEALLRIQQNTATMLEGSGIALHIEDENAIKEDIKMPLDYSRNLILIFKEAVNNAIKYAQAKNIYLHFYEDIDNSIVLSLRDDGTGFDVNAVSKGNGLKNIQNRTEKIKGKISITSEPNAGTTLRLRMFKYSFDL